MKRFLCFLLAVFLLLSFTGCTSQQANDPTEPTPLYAEGIPAITAEQVDRIVNSDFQKPNNIILLIGDGMGPNDITITSQHGTDLYDFGLVLDRIPHHGFATTHSASNAVTDSAASGTALATGTKTDNNMLGILPDGTVLENISEIARKHGKKIGIVTDDSITGATTSAFLVHNPDRTAYDQIYDSALRFGPDVYIGKVDIIRYTQALSEGYNAASRFQQVPDVLKESDDPSKPVVTFNGGYSTTINNELAQSTQLALNLLDNENGFFLMVESCGTDKFGHSNSISGKITSVTVLDRTLASILLFMETHPDTLLIVTSDHETGGVQLPDDGFPVTNELFTSEDHTAEPVRVFALGQGSAYFHGKTVDNTDIAKFLIDALQ